MSALRTPCSRFGGRCSATVGRYSSCCACPARQQPARLVAVAPRAASVRPVRESAPRALPAAAGPGQPSLAPQPTSSSSSSSSSSGAKPHRRRIAAAPTQQAAGWAKSEADLPPLIPVVCNGISGLLVPGPMKVVCGCASCVQLELTDPARAFLPTPWENHCGNGHYKKWSRSIRAVLAGGRTMCLRDYFWHHHGVTFTRGGPKRPPGKVFHAAGVIADS